MVMLTVDDVLRLAGVVCELMSVLDPAVWWLSSLTVMMYCYALVG